jgi:protein phosphatase
VTRDDPPVPDASHLIVPDPCLVVLVGAAGAGKSTFAARHFAPDEVLSSDGFRERIAGDPADQAATGPAFAALHRAVRRRLSSGRLTVVDATSVGREHRRPLLRAAAASGIPCIAIVFDLPPGVVLARNAGRPGRVVPDEVVRRHLRRLADAVRPPGLAAEGFAAVVVLRDPAAVDRVTVDRVTVVRGASVGPGGAGA